MPSLFKRRSPDVEDAVPAAPDPAVEVRRKGYTPSKEELGKKTPKRPTDGRRRAEPPPANRKDAMKRAREKAKEDRVERRAAMMAGDDRYLLGRDKGPERALVRDIVDRRLTVGTWFFGGALIVLIGSTVRVPIIQLASNLLWALLAIAVIVDSVLIARRVKKLVLERFPKTKQKLGSLQLYGVMRALSFRRMRVPKPQAKFGDKI